MDIWGIQGLQLDWAFHAVRRGRLIGTRGDLSITAEDIKSVMADWPGFMLRRMPAGTEVYHKQNPNAVVYAELAERAVARVYLLLMAKGRKIEIPGFIMELESGAS